MFQKGVHVARLFDKEQKRQNNKKVSKKKQQYTKAKMQTKSTKKIKH